jgi:hypothetical protein
VNKEIRMNRLVSCLILSISAAAATPAFAGIACGGCWGSFLCPQQPSGCPAGAIVVNIPSGKTTGNASLIQSAITKANEGAVICVGRGTYSGDINFMGKAITLKSSTPLGAILHGSGTAPVVTFDSNESSASVLEGFEITGGSGQNSNGGGILILNASPTISNCLVTGNRVNRTMSNSSPRGGGAYVGGSEAAPSILCSCFQGNHSDFEGGGLETADFAHPYLDDDSFESNDADFGGGLAADLSGLTNIENSEFAKNSAGGDGGAIHVLTQFGTTMVRRTLISSNTAGGNGGGLWVAAGFATVLNAQFDSNSATEGGGAAAGFDSVVSVESSIFVFNTTSDSAGATLFADTTAPGTSLVNNYNLFFGNTVGTIPSPPDSLNTLGNIGILDANPDFEVGGCFPVGPGSPTVRAGIPDSHFANAGGSRNTMGIHGGPVVP